MTQHLPLRLLRLPILIPGMVTAVLLVANLVPQASFSVPVILDPSSRQRPPCDAVLQYGWPRIARVDEGNDFLGPSTFYAQTSRTSVVTQIANGVFGVALVLLSALAARLIVDRRISLEKKINLRGCNTGRSAVRFVRMGRVA